MTGPSSDASPTTDGGSSGGCPAATGSHTMTALYTDSDQILAMRLSGGLLYFSDYQGIWSLPVAGGTPTKVATIAMGAMPVGPFAITSTQVVWADKGNAFNPSLHAQALSGGAVTDLMGPTNLSVLFGLEATDTAAYPLDEEGVNLYSVPLNGSASTTLAMNTDLGGLVVVGSTLYFENGFSGTPANQLLSIALPNGTPKMLADVGLGTGPMSSDGQNLYLSSNLNQQYSLAVYPLAGGQVTTLYSSSSDTSVFTSVSGRVYFGQQCTMSPATYALYEIGADKSKLQVDVDGLDRPTAMVADASYVYVATTQFGAVGSSHIQRFAR
jgi:hypothetical protein